MRPTVPCPLLHRAVMFKVFRVYIIEGFCPCLLLMLKMSIFKMTFICAGCPTKVINHVCKA